MYINEFYFFTNENYIPFLRLFFVGKNLQYVITKKYAKTKQRLLHRQNIQNSIKHMKINSSKTAAIRAKVCLETHYYIFTCPNFRIITWNHHSTNQIAEDSGVCAGTSHVEGGRDEQQFVAEDPSSESTSSNKVKHKRTGDKSGKGNQGSALPTRPVAPTRPSVRNPLVRYVHTWKDRKSFSFPWNTFGVYFTNNT